MSMADHAGFIGYRGQLVPWRAAATPVLPPFPHYGLPAFDGVRAYKNAAGTAIVRRHGHAHSLTWA